VTPRIRFDDLRPTHRRGFALGPIARVIVARTLDEVTGALKETEAEVKTGNWVGGWVSYGAGPAFDPALEVRPQSGTAFEDLPLVWMAVSSRRTAPPPPTSAPHSVHAWTPMTSVDHHQQAIVEIRRRIAAGDTYQVNHTFMMRSPFEGDVASFYDRLIQSQSCGYGALIESGDWAVVSASPELFFEWRHGTVTCRPMKGTAPRGVDLPRDAEMRSWLEKSEKNRAENVMIVDMVRNDLGRVAAVGSVAVPALFTAEKYDTVWQLTSTVTARPRPEVTLADVFSALFPSASITGAPKVSTMRIISRLETHPRGIYCGAVGFGGPGPEGPEWAFNVGIRTVVIDCRTATAYYGTGGGITYDSQPDEEYAEALLKAEVLTRRGDRLRLLETTRWDPRRGARHLDRHFERAAASAAYFDIPFDPAEVRAALARAVKERETPALLRILVDREGRVSAEVDELPESSGPVELVVDDRPVDRDDPFLYHKTTIRGVYDETRSRHPEADDVVLWNDAGEITETTIGNLAVRLDGAWVTPPVRRGLLAGTERASRLATGELAEMVVTLDQLEQATGLARLNSVRGWQTARLRWTTDHPTRSLRADLGGKP
jgi:para-aminobenzoate synthetase / 4-amino-4-deoxychorismate lyase